MNKAVFIITYPIRLVFLALIYFYKACISPLLPKVCRYHPSCSTYMLIAIERFGPIRGAIMGLKRIMRCSPKYPCGLDPVPDNIKGNIKWLV